MRKIYLNSVVWREDEYYVAQCLDVDVSSFGDTKQEALDNLTEALELYFEDKDIKPIAHIREPELAQVSVKQS